MISKHQAYILGNLLLYGEIRLYIDGFSFYGDDKVDGRSLLGLIKRGLLRVSASKTMPSIGHLASPVFYDDGVTDEGKNELKKHLDSVPYLERYNTPWMKKVYQSLATSPISE
ncbi:unnamed protein product, partial [marine sediment metagenome]